MSSNFDYSNWIRENKVGPYSKDSSAKRKLNESYEEGIVEDESIEEAPIPPSPENIYEPEHEQDVYDRAWGLVGMQIKQVIDDLRADGFEDGEIKDIMFTAVDMYDQAFSGMDEGEVSEAYGSYHVNRKYPTDIPGIYQDDEGNYFNSKGQDTDSRGNVISYGGSSGSYPKPRTSGEIEAERAGLDIFLNTLVKSGKVNSFNHALNIINKARTNKGLSKVKPSVEEFLKQHYSRLVKS